jgi:AcrR family transcriptional regulator
MSTKKSPKPLRADAERNRQRVLEVAQEVFASEGLAVPIDEIARRAELGVGTLYRHFPTKEALFEAIVVGRMQALIDEAKAHLTAQDPGEALFAVLSRVIEEGALKKDFIEALVRASFDVARSLGSIKQELHEAVEQLLKRAQRAKAVRRDVDGREVMALAMGMLGAFERLGVDAKGRARLLGILRDGLRPPAAR